MPPDTETFLAVFADYNRAIWPAQIAGYLLGAAALVLAARGTKAAARAIFGILGLFWVVNGLGYHAGFFARVNPAAWAFAVLFAAQGGLLLWHAARGPDPGFALRPGWRRAVGLALIVYAMAVYPVLGAALGHSWPRAPVFSTAPCPTTIFTLGMLLLAERPPGRLFALPLVWAAIGGSAVFLFGMTEDLGLVVAAAAAVPVLVRPTRRA